MCFRYPVIAAQKRLASGVLQGGNCGWFAVFVVACYSAKCLRYEARAATCESVFACGFAVSRAAGASRCTSGHSKGFATATAYWMIDWELLEELTATRNLALFYGLVQLRLMQPHFMLSKVLGLARR